MVSQISQVTISQVRSGRPLRVLVVGNSSLQADALTHLLNKHCDDFHLLSPLYGLEHVLPFLQHAEPVDVILLLNAQLPQDRTVLYQLQQARQRCLLMSCFVPTPYMIAQIKEAGAWGVLEATCSLADLSSAIRGIASGRTSFPDIIFPQRRATHPSISIQRASMHTSHQVIFAPQILEECARAIGWTLSEQDRAILGHFFEKTEEIAKQMERPAASIRHAMSVRAYDFLSLLTNAPVRDRAAACRTLLEWGIYQVMASDAALHPEKKSTQEREHGQPPDEI